MFWIDLELVTNYITAVVRQCQRSVFAQYSKYTLLNITFYNGIIMLLSHCGEYPGECKQKYSRQIRQKVANIRRMGLRMQFATNRNDRKMIARHS